MEVDGRTMAAMPRSPRIVSLVLAAVLAIGSLVGLALPAAAAEGAEHAKEAEHGFLLLRQIPGLEHAHALVLQREAHQLNDRGLVIHDEHGGHGRPGRGASPMPGSPD